jgi:diguanylate cyclase (GGDEF)-like protein
MAATPIQPAPISPQQADARFIAATETSLDAFFIFAPLRGSDGKVEDFTFTWLNQNGEKLLSKPRKEILGARLTQLLPIDAEPKSLDHYRLVLLTGKPYIHEFPLKEDDVYSTWMRHHVVKLEDGIAITVTDITERRHTEQYLLHLTQHDALTGLPTRALLDDRIAQAIARANRYRTKVAVFLIGVESSSPITEPHDRSVQDDITVITANRLRSAIRSTDSIIRLGGDEFVVVMTDISLTSDIRRAAATLVAVLSPSIAVEDQEIPITCTLGVSIYPDTAATIQDLLSGADVAMYRAQTQGENQYVLFTPASEDDAQECAD